ncbi:MAG: substrate-binding domain-containing protein, partial [Vallitaleaceae bacterium]|nr:substrate-binding domain-containing protein [Vallitaleaceae bacterium]
HQEILEEAEKYDNIRIIYKDAANDTDKQIEDINELMDYGIDLLIVSMNDSDVLTPIVGDIYSEIPVIVLDRAVDGYDYTLFIGLDNYQLGYEAGSYMASLPRVRNIVEITGIPTSIPTSERSLGFVEALSTQAAFVSKQIVGNWEKDIAEDSFYQVLEEDAGVDAVYAHSDDMGFGAYLAASTLGRDLFILGFDGLLGDDRGLDLVRKGILDATFICPTGGKEAIRYAVDILSKESGIPKKIILRTEFVTIDNVDNIIKAESTPAVNNTDQEIIMGYAQIGSESTWRNANSESIIEAAKEAGIELIFKNVDNSLSDREKQAKQIEFIEEFIMEGVDVIAFTPIIETGWDDVLLLAKEAGIPVILSDRRVDASNDLWSTYMGSDFEEEGRRAARWLVEHTDSSEVYQIVELVGTTGSAPAIGRHKGFKEIIAGIPNYEIIYSAGANFEYEDGKETMEDALKIYGDTIDVVYAHNDDMALGAIEAIEAYGLVAGVDILIISVDATKAALNMIIVEKLNCAVECNPLLGPQIMKAVKDLMAGVELPIEIITGESVYTIENTEKEIKIRKY